MAEKGEKAKLFVNNSHDVLLFLGKLNPLSCETKTHTTTVQLTQARTTRRGEFG